MTFAAPLLFAAGLGAAAAVVALHFLARQLPRAVPFPTARFIPERVARAPSRAITPSDLLLLALRVAALVLLGAAFARPAWEGSRRGTVRVIAVDRSRAVRRAAEARDSVLALLGARDRLVLFDSASHEVATHARDSVARLAVVPVAGSLSAALMAAERAGAAASRDADSVELIIVSGLSREEWDAATRSVRALWPGSIRLVRVAMALPDPPRTSVDVRGAADDPLRSAGFDGQRTIQRVRVVRGALMEGDRAWAIDSGAVIVHWPVRVDGAPVDTIGAVAVADDVVVAPFARRAALEPGGATVVARWADGAPAAIERAAGASGCVREVAIPVPIAGDLVLRESFRRVVAGLLAPCGGARDVRPLTDSQLTALRGAGPLAAGRSVAATAGTEPALSTWLLIAAIVLLAVELFLQRRAP